MMIADEVHGAMTSRAQNQGFAHCQATNQDADRPAGSSAGKTKGKGTYKLERQREGTTSFTFSDRFTAPKFERRRKSGDDGSAERTPKLTGKCKS